MKNGRPTCLRWSDNSTAGALWQKSWTLAYPLTASGVLSQAPKQNSLRQSETTDTADAASNCIGSLAGGKVETVGKPPTSFPLGPRRELGPCAGGMSLSGNGTCQDKSRAGIASVPPAVTYSESSRAAKFRWYSKLRDRECCLNQCPFHWRRSPLSPSSSPEDIGGER